MNKLLDQTKIPFKIALFYAIAAGLWILFSDKLLASLVTDQALITRVSILKGWIFVLFTALLLYWLTRDYVVALVEKDETLRTVVQGVSEATGEEFFASLVKHLATVLHADYTMIGELTEAETLAIRTISVFGKGELLANFEYALAGTPCAEVTTNDSSCFYPGGVRLRFPDDRLLAEMGIESYIGMPLRDSSGRPLGIIVAMSCTPMEEKSLADTLFRLFAVRAVAELERRRSEASLRESEERYRLLFDCNPHPMWVYDAETLAFLMVNQAAVTHYGYTRDEFLAMTIKDIRPEEDLPALLSRLEGEVPNHGKAGIWRHRTKEGSLIDVEITSNSAPFAGKSAKLVLANDITQQLQAERALQNQFSQLTAIFDSINALVYVADLTTEEILYVNRCGSSLFGPDWLGKSCSEIFRNSQNAPGPFCKAERLVTDGNPLPPYIYEFQNTATGTWYQCIDRAIPWTDGRLVRLEIAFDITDRKGIERMKDELISAVSHEMRTPLTAMLGYSEYMLEQEVPADQQKEFIRTIHHETERLNELIGNFLDLQRLRMRPEPLDVASLPVEPLLRDVCELFGAEPKKHRLILALEPDCPMVIGNAGQLHQVLLNLVSNAVKYSPAQSVITVGARREGENVVLWVQDEGIGIPPDMLEKIFERFYRIDNTDRRLVGGAGLGLALVRGIVEAHHGTVWAESTLGHGSTFSVRLPATPEAT